MVEMLLVCFILFMIFGMLFIMFICRCMILCMVFIIIFMGSCFFFERDIFIIKIWWLLLKLMLGNLNSVFRLINGSVLLCKLIILRMVDLVRGILVIILGICIIFWVFFSGKVYFCLFIM